MSLDEIRAALDDVPLTTLDVMRNQLAINIRRASNCGQHDIADDYRRQFGVVESEVLQRTVRIAHRASFAWTSAEDTRLRRLSLAGETIECIASTLGRSTVAITARGKLFGIQFGDDGTMVGRTALDDGRAPHSRPECRSDAEFSRIVRGAL